MIDASIGQEDISKTYFHDKVNQVINGILSRMNVCQKFLVHMASPGKKEKKLYIGMKNSYSHLLDAYSNG